MKQGVLVMWLVLAAGMVFGSKLGSGWVANVAFYAFWGMAFVHVVEFFVKKSVLEKAGGSMGRHFFQTLIYGLFHWKPLEEQQATAAGEES